MARDQPWLLNWAQYLAVRGLAGLLQCFDIDENLHSAKQLGTLYHASNRRRRERAERNITLSFPDWSPQRVSQVARESMQHVFQLLMVDAIVTPRMITADTWPEVIRFGDVSAVLHRLVRGRPMILITGHCGNWELLGVVLSALGYPTSALARPIDNPLINRWVMEVREARGTKIITKWGATPLIQQILGSGGRVGFIADQNAGESGLFVPFFGRLASTYKSIGLLAMRYRVPIIAGHARRVAGRFRYEISCGECILPEEWDRQPDPLYYITARYSRAIEGMIRLAPEQYLWAHRRWKSRPKHERLGKPMPERLLAKLRALPWMTPSELDRIVEQSQLESCRYQSEPGAR